jgi:hypothetical protein
MRRDQAPNGVFLQVGIEMAKEIGDLVGIGRQAGERGILLPLIPCDGGFRVISNCANVDVQQAIEFLRRNFTVKRRHRTCDLFCIGHDFLRGGIPLLRIVRRDVRYDVPNPKDVPDPEIAKGLPHLLYTGWIRIPDCSRFEATARQANERKDQHRHRLKYLVHKALHRYKVER